MKLLIDKIKEYLGGISKFVSVILYPIFLFYCFTKNKKNVGENVLVLPSIQR